MLLAAAAEQPTVVDGLTTDGLLPVAAAAVPQPAALEQPAASVAAVSGSAGLTAVAAGVCSAPCAQPAAGPGCTELRAGSWCLRQHTVAAVATTHRVLGCPVAHDMSTSTQL